MIEHGLSAPAARPTARPTAPPQLPPTACASACGVSGCEVAVVLALTAVTDRPRTRTNNRTMDLDDRFTLLSPYSSRRFPARSRHTELWGVHEPSKISVSPDQCEQKALSGQCRRPRAGSSTSRESAPMRRRTTTK